MSSTGSHDVESSLATPAKVVDEPVDDVAYGGRRGRCRVRIYHTAEKATIVVYSALSGPPLAYACEELVAQLLARYFSPGIDDPSSITWLEHQPAADRPLLQAHVAARDVRFGALRWPAHGLFFSKAPVVRQPVWRDLTAAEVTALIGERLE